MARKKKLDDLTPPVIAATKPNVDPGRQPRVLGWMVLIVGASSTWYWYRPLPPAANETANATLPTSWPTSTTGPKSLWSEQGLVVPSISDTRGDPTVSPSELLAAEQSSPTLVGPPKVSLVPWNEPRQELADVLKKETLPSLPIETILSKQSLESPKPWTPPSMTGPLNASQAERREWPDSGYVPQPNPNKAKQRAASKITAKIPPLLETGMKSIRTTEDLEPTAGAVREKPISGNTANANLGQPSPTLSNPAIGSAPPSLPAALPPGDTQIPSRQPAFIRQPHQR